MFSVILMGLTAYRIHSTKSKSGTDVLTARTHFYSRSIMIYYPGLDLITLFPAPIIAELLTVSIMGTLFSLWMSVLDSFNPAPSRLLSLIFFLGFFVYSQKLAVASLVYMVSNISGSRYCSLCRLWVPVLSQWVVGSYYSLRDLTMRHQHEFSNLRWCRYAKACRILEAIKAFSWIFWGWTIFLILTTLMNMLRNHADYTGAVHGRRDTQGSYPTETRSTETTMVTQDQPVTASRAVPSHDVEQHPQQFTIV